MSKTKEELSKEIIEIQTEIELLYRMIYYYGHTDQIENYNNRSVKVNELRDEYFKLI